MDTCRKLVIWTCFGTIGLLMEVKGMTLTGSPYAVLDQTYQFTCNFTGSTTTTTLTFRRDTASVCTIFLSLSDPSQCQELSATPGYNCSCGQNGVYYMDISSVSLQDEDTWYCQLPSEPPQNSNNISLSVYFGPFNNVTINQTSPVTVIEGVTTGSVRCSAHCKPGCSYTWKKGSQQVSNSDLSLGGFRKGQEGNYTCTARNPRTSVTADSQTLTVSINWYPAQPTHNCPSWIVVGQSGSCSCQTSDPGYPAGTVQWINPQGQTVSSSLNLANIPRSDNGRNYICRAANSLANSNKDTSYSVNIAFGPAGVSITGNQQTAAPDVLTLTCTTIDPVNPAPTLTWRNSTNGPVLPGSNPVPVQSPQDGGYVYRSTLSITTQWYQDGDTIVCEGRNSRIQSQSVTDSQVLDVIYPPQSQPVISGISSSPIYEGDSVTLTCRVTGGKPLVTTVTLTCPGGHQNSTTTTTEGSDTRVTTLTFSVSRDLRSQPCRCSADHSTGNYQLTTNMTIDDIYYPPSIQTVSVSQSLPWLEGRTGTLTCVLSDAGHPSATYIWYRDGVRQTQQTGQSWLFPSLTYTDNGRQIYCQAENQFTVNRGPVVKSSNTTLNVYFSPIVQTSPSSSITKIEGEALTVKCTAVSNPHPTGYQWTFGSVTKSTGPQLSLPDLNRTDHGEYRCNVTTQAGSHGSLTGTASVQVIVNYSPDLMLTNVTETETQTATVRCQADGRPENFNFSPFVHTWRSHVIRHVTGEKDRKIYQRVFASSSYQDSGVYVCEVGNGVPDRQGVTQHKGNISVQINASPKLTVGMDEESIVGVEVGENTTLFRTFYSQTSITSYTWSKDGQTLNNTLVSDTTVQLDIYGVMVEDEGYNLTLIIGLFDNDIHQGQYNLQVCNSVGCESSNINLTAAGPPLTPTQFQTLENITKTAIWLSWKPSFPGGVYTQTFIVEYRMTGGQWKEFGSFIDTEEDVMVVEVNSLTPGTMYEFRMYAKNTRETKNRSEYTDIIQETTKKDEPPGVPGALIGGAVGASAAIICIVIVVAVVIIRKRKAGKKDDGSKLALHENAYGADREKPEMHDNVLYDTSEGARGFEKPVMEDNVLYAGSGDIGGAASSGGAEYAVVQKKSNAKKNKEKTNGDTYATPQKKGKTTQQKGEKATDLYALPQKKEKEKDKKAEKKKDKKKDKKADKKQANPRKQKRVDVYENTVPGQFGSETEASTYANAGFVGDENHYEETPGATANAETPAYGRDEDGLLYVGIDFGNQKPSQEVHGAEDSTEYAGIAFGKVGPPLPPDEEEKDEEKK